MSSISCEFCFKSCESPGNQDPPENAFQCLAKYLSLEGFGNAVLRCLCADCGRLLTSFSSLFYELQSCELALRSVLEKLSNVLQSAEKEETWRGRHSGGRVLMGGGSELRHWRHKVVSLCKKRCQNTSPLLPPKPYHPPEVVTVEESTISVKAELEDIDNNESNAGSDDEDVDLKNSPVSSSISGGCSDNDFLEEEVPFLPPVKRRKIDDEKEVSDPLPLEEYVESPPEVKDERLEEVKVEVEEMTITNLGEAEGRFVDAVPQGGNRKTVSKSPVKSNRAQPSSPNSHPCPECGMSFSTKSWLKKHLLVHPVTKNDDDESDQKSSKISKKNSKNGGSSRGKLSKTSLKSIGSEQAKPDKVKKKRIRRRPGLRNISDDTKDSTQVGAELKQADGYEGVATEAEALERFMSSRQPRFTCPVERCRAWFVLKAEAERHFKMHGSWTCHSEGCEFTTNFAPNLAVHEVAHNASTEDDTEQPSKCLRCNFSANEKSTVMSHLISLHLGIQLAPLQCPICDISLKVTGFETPSNLRSGFTFHFKVMHDVSKLKPEDVQKCDKCPAYFSSTDRLRRHKRRKHLDNSVKKRYPCSICSQKFWNFTSIRIHKIKKHKLDPEKDFEFECPNVACKMRWHTQFELDRHVKSSHGNKLEEDTTQLCPHCGKSFPGRNNLMSHINMAHIRQREVKRFVCEQCGRVCSTKVRLRTHLLSHSGPESWKYSCDQCGRKCTTVTLLKQHLRRHTNEKPYVCEVCGQKYADRMNWRNHVTSKHPEVGKQLGIKPTVRGKSKN